MGKWTCTGTTYIYCLSPRPFARILFIYTVFSCHIYTSFHLHFVICPAKSLQQTPVHIKSTFPIAARAASEHKFKPTADASTLLLPHPFKCWHTPDGSCSLPSSSFPPHLADDCQPTSASPPVFLFLSFHSVSLFAILWFSQINRENPCRDRKSSASDREAHRLWSLTADEAHRRSWMTDLGKSCREANVAGLVCSTTTYTDKQTATELRVTGSELTATKLRVSNLPPTHTPPSLLLLFCLHTLLSSLTVTTFHLIAESPHLLCTISSIQHTLHRFPFTFTFDYSVCLTCVSALFSLKC